MRNENGTVTLTDELLSPSSEPNGEAEGTVRPNGMQMTPSEMDPEMWAFLLKCQE